MDAKSTLLNERLGSLLKQAAAVASELQSIEQGGGTLDQDVLASSFDDDTMSKEVGEKVRSPLNNIISDRESHVFNTIKNTM